MCLLHEKSNDAGQRTNKALIKNKTKIHTFWIIDRVRLDTVNPHEVTIIHLLLYFFLLDYAAEW